MKIRVNVNLSHLFSPSISGADRQALIQKEILKISLCLNGGDRERTSVYLGITIRTLRNWLKQAPELNKLIIRGNDPMRQIKARRLRYMLNEYDY